MQAPDPRLKVTYKGAAKELYMSFLRLNSCLRVIGGMDQMAAMMIDPDIGENIVRVMVAPKGGPGEMFEIELEDEDLNPEDFDRVLNFARDHLTHFFVRRLQAATANAADLEATIKALRSSVPGSEISSSSEASVGRSA